MSYVWGAVEEDDVAVFARRAIDALPPDGLVLVHDFMVNNTRDTLLLQPGTSSEASWITLMRVSHAGYVEGALKQAGFEVEKTDVMLAGITMLTTALKPI